MLHVQSLAHYDLLPTNSDRKAVLGIGSISVALRALVALVSMLA